jgi:hypothetical protein
MTLRVVGLALAAATLLTADDSKLTGSWTGDSICTGVRPACQNEHVIWTFKAPDRNGHVAASADKVVNGERVNMGLAEFEPDKEVSTWVWKISLGVWRIVLDKDTIEGTLTLNEGGIARHMNLKRDKS